MADTSVEANLELGLDWLNALRDGEIHAIEERFDPAVEWVAVSGEVACRGRTQVLDWLRGSGRRAHQVVGLELLASDTHLIVGIDDPGLSELAGVRLDGRLHVVFAVQAGQIVSIHDHARRDSALEEAGLTHHTWS